jgi:excisionase family DNA binding protein
MANVLTLEEVASYLRVHPSTVYRMLKKSKSRPSRSAVIGGSISSRSTIGGLQRSTDTPIRHNESARLRTEAVPPLVHAAQFAREDSKRGAQPVKRRRPPSRQSYYSSFEV